MKERIIRVGMVGGGPGAGIAETHRTAMRLDDKYLLVAGVFSRDREKSLTAARRLRIDLDRVYFDYERMAEVESKRKNDQIDAVVIVTRTWNHEDPCHLRFSPIDGPPQILAQGAAWLSPEASRWTRVGLGHPEGFFESFANLYTEVAEAILVKSEGGTYPKTALGFPDASDGACGVAFVESAMRSFAAGGAWTAVEAI